MLTSFSDHTGTIRPWLENKGSSRLSHLTFHKGEAFFFLSDFSKENADLFKLDFYLSVCFGFKGGSVLQAEQCESEGTFPDLHVKRKRDEQLNALMVPGIVAGTL